MHSQNLSPTEAPLKLELPLVPRQRRADQQPLSRKFRGVIGGILGLVGVSGAAGAVIAGACSPRQEEPPPAASVDLGLAEAGAPDLAASGRDAEQTGGPDGGSPDQGGSATDSDGDGIPDALDLCPDVPGVHDRDGDSLCDKAPPGEIPRDTCPPEDCDTQNLDPTFCYSPVGTADSDGDNKTGVCDPNDSNPCVPLSDAKRGCGREAGIAGDGPVDMGATDGPADAAAVDISGGVDAAPDGTAATDQGAADATAGDSILGDAATVTDGSEDQYSGDAAAAMDAMSD